MPEGTLKREKLRYYFDQTRMLIVLIIIVAAFSILSPYFLKVRNLYAIGLTISVIGIVCIGQSLVLLTTGFDLSVGSISGFAGMVVASLTKRYEHYWLMFFIGLAIGATIGLTNGLLITKAGINPLITTLSMMSIFQGATFLVSKGFAIAVNLDSFRFLGTTRVFGTPLPIIILVGLYVIFFFVLRYTVFGRYIYSIGGNAEAAKLSGINVDKIRILVYMLSGMLSAFGGNILASRLGAAQTTAGSQYPLNSIAACVLGGISIAGGEGVIFGSLIGVAIIGVLQSGLIMINMPSYYQWIANGIVLIIAVYVDTMRKN
ncbi:MAG: ABC transporter permease [Spirochaetes bacterium]|nr:ABC transporter permease [Spirochaetota bacterium]